MTNALSPIPAAKAQSISRRFSYAFIGVVTLFLCAFATTAIVVNMGKLETTLAKRVENVVALSQISLPTPLWNLDHKIVAEYIAALFLDESLVYAEVVSAGLVITTKTRPAFQSKDFAFFAQSAQFLSQRRRFCLKATPSARCNLPSHGRASGTNSCSTSLASWRSRSF